MRLKQMPRVLRRQVKRLRRHRARVNGHSAIGLRRSRVLAVSYFGVATCLERQGEALNYEAECVGEGCLLTDGIGEPPGDGAWVYEGSMSGSRGCWANASLLLLGRRVAPCISRVEQRCVAGEWVWESLPEAQFRAASHSWLRRRQAA